MNFATAGPGGDFDYLFKLLLIGNSGVGKSCMLLRYSENSFTTNFFNTIGVDFKIKSIALDGKNIKLQIWDTAGQDRFRTITSSYYRGAQGILVVYDITDRDSFDNVRNWMHEIDKYAQENVIRVLIGNKSDLPEKRKVSYDEGQALAKQYGITFFETSAKNASNIDMSFQSIARVILEKSMFSGGRPTEVNKLDKKLQKTTANKNNDSCC